MWNFKVGDKVVCVEGFPSSPPQKEGHIYTIRFVGNDAGEAKVFLYFVE